MCGCTSRRLDSGTLVPQDSSHAGTRRFASTSSKSCQHPIDPTRPTTLLKGKEQSRHTSNVESTPKTLQPAAEHFGPVQELAVAEEQVPPEEVRIPIHSERTPQIAVCDPMGAVEEESRRGVEVQAAMNRDARALHALQILAGS